MRKFRIRPQIVILVFISVLYCDIFCQENNNIVLDANTRSKTIKKICSMLNENYVLPRTAEKMSSYLKSRLGSGSYDSYNTPQKFAEIITADMQSVSKDLHLKLRYNPDTAKRLKESANTGPDPEQEKKFLAAIKNENFGFKTVSQLSGNIGYVDLRQFFDAKISAETIAAVMSFLRNTNAIIFEIRINGGGDPTCVQLICSYLFDRKPVHLNDLYYRPGNKTEEYWTLKNIDGERMPDIPVYILTSDYTFSAA